MHVVHYQQKYETFAHAMEAEHDREAISVMAVFVHVNLESRSAIITLSTQNSPPICAWLDPTRGEPGNEAHRGRNGKID